MRLKTVYVYNAFQPFSLERNEISQIPEDSRHQTPTVKKKKLDGVCWHNATDNSHDCDSGPYPSFSTISTVSECVEKVDQPKTVYFQ